MRIFRKLTQLLDVEIVSPVDNDRLQYEASSGKWKNTSVSGVAPHHGSHEEGGDDEVSVTVGMIDAEASTDGQVPTSDGAGGVTWEDQSGSSGGAPADATYITQTANGDLSAEQALSALATGLVKVTTGTGVLSTATGGTDYANASHQHAGEDITSGTVADARIASTIARDSEVTSAISALSSVYQAKDTTLDTYAGIDPSANVQSVLSAADYAAIRTLLGLVIGTNVQAYDADLTTYAGISPSANVQSLLGAADYAAMRTLLGLVIGTNVQAFDAELAALAGLTSAADRLPYFTGSGTASLATFTTAGRNLVDDADTAAQRTTLDVYSKSEIATELADQKRVVAILVSDPLGSAITTGDGKACFRVPSLLNGHNLVSVGASVSTVSSSGIPTVQLRRMRRSSATAQSAADMLSTKLTIDATEFDSSDATNAAVIDTSNDDVATGDQINVDIDVAGTGAKGLVVTMTFEAP